MKNKSVVIALLGLIIVFTSCGQRPPGDQTEADSSTQTEGAEVSQGPMVPVEAMVIRKQTVEQNVPLTGVAQPVLAVDIIAEVSGKVEKIIKKLGDAVTPSDTLAVIDDRIPLSNYRQAQAQALSAENNLKIAELNLNSDEELLQAGDISQLAYENSLLAKKSAEANHLSALANLSLMEKTYEDTRLMSPIRGYVSRKHIDLGTMVSPGMPVYRVVDLSTLKIEVGVPQSMISRVRVGSEATIRFSALGQDVYDGSVRYVSPQADESTGAFTAEIHVQNTRDMRIKAGMTAKIDLILTELGEQLVIPNYAVVTRNGSRFAYRIENGTAKLTEITAHTAFGSQIVVDSGLAEGDTIVVVGMKNLGVDTKVLIETVNTN